MSGIATCRWIRRPRRYRNSRTPTAGPFGGYVEQAHCSQRLYAVMPPGYLRGTSTSGRRSRPRRAGRSRRGVGGVLRRAGQETRMDTKVAPQDDLLRRFANRLLGDQVERVARDPIRKLGARDRLIGAASMCLEQGVASTHLAFAAAAAIRYDHPADPAAQSIQERLKREGLSGVLREVCGIDPDSPLARLIEKGNRRLLAQGWVRGIVAE